MTTDRLDGAPMRERLARLRAAIDAAPDPPPPRPAARRAARSRRAAPAAAEPARMSGPLVLAIESSCDETGIALVEDGRRIHANVVASQVALHAATGGIVPEVAARAHLRWIVPVLEAAWSDAGVGWSRRRRRSPSPTARGWPGRSSSASTSPRRSPTSTTSRSSGSTTSRATSRPAGCSTRARIRPPARAAVPARRPRRVRRPHVPGRDARPRRLPAARPDRRRRRRRGVRQGGPPARARLPGRSGDPGRRRGRDAARRPLPAGLARRLVRLQLQRAQDGRPADRGRGPGRRGPAGRRPDGPALRRRPSPSSPGASRTPSSTSSRRRRSGPPARSGARSIVLGGGVAANAALRARIEGDAAELGLPLVVPRPGLCTDNGAMIGAAGARRFAAGERSGLDLDARPSLPLATR